MGKLQDLAVSSAPTFKCLIPSTGKMVKVRSFLVKEQKLLLMAKESDSNATDAIVGAVTQLIQNCVLEDLDVSKLPSFDVEYMFVQLFINSTASKQTTAHYQCRADKLDEAGLPAVDEHGDHIKCNEINKVRIDLSTAKIPTSEIKSGIIEVNSDTIDKIIFKYPSFEQMTTITSSVASDNLDNAFLTYGNCLKTIYKKDGSMMAFGEDFDALDAVEFLEYMPGPVFEKITEFFNEAPTVTADVQFKCKTCGNEAELKLRGLEDFF
ncbi:T4 bacteriophage base plate protein [compost metagenome]